MQRRRVLMEMQSELPGAYQKVEWLGKKDGEIPYIKTNYYSGASPSAEFMFDLVNDDGTGDQAVFGWLGDGSEQGFYFDIYASGQAVYSATLKSRWRNPTRLTKGRYTCSINADAMTINGTEYAPQLTGVENNARALSIFCATATDDVGVTWHSYNKIIRIYYLRIYSQGLLDANFVPCVRKSDSKPGMYDTVTKTFYTNAGTGEFIVPA